MAQRKKTSTAGKRKTSSSTTKKSKSTAKKKATTKKKSSVKNKTAARKATKPQKKGSAGKKITTKARKTTKKPIKPKKISSTKKSSATRRATTKKSIPRKKQAVANKITAKKSTARKVQREKPVIKSTGKKKKTAAKKSTRRVSTYKPPFSAYNGSRPYLFVSYSHSDMNEVFRMIMRVNEFRYRIWYDEGIEPGNEWPEVVGKAIEKCSQFMVFISPNSINSRHVRNEINYAFNAGKPLIVVFIKDTKLTEGMKLQLGTVQFIKRYELTKTDFYEKLKSVLLSKLKN